MYTNVTVKYTDKDGVNHVKQSVQMDAVCFMNFVYASAILQGWNITSVMTISL